jgi:SOS-response transcriptional repressor LexA
MEQRFTEGDVLVLQPSNEIHSGCLAVVRLATDGVVFRRVEMRKDTIRLVALNPQYGPEDIPRSDVLWAYPLYGMWRQVWK